MYIITRYTPLNKFLSDTVISSQICRYNHNLNFLVTYFPITGIASMKKGKIDSRPEPQLLKKYQNLQFLQETQKH